MAIPVRLCAIKSYYRHNVQAGSFPRLLRRSTNYENIFGEDFLKTETGISVLGKSRYTNGSLPLNSPVAIILMYVS
ncbi:hypothetical protein KOXY103107_03625 [Komagataeibacter xylinus]